MSLFVRANQPKSKYSKKPVARKEGGGNGDYSMLQITLSGFGIARNVNQKGFKEVTVNPFINATLTGLRAGSVSNHV